MLDSEPLVVSRGRRQQLHPVLVAGVVLVAVQVAVRAWASFNSWFSADDYNLMSRLYNAPLTVGELFTPHDSQLMPGGIFFAWLIANAGPHNWTVAASTLVMWQAIASAACLLMLVTLFGRRWEILPLLLIYLASPLTLTAYMWWAAAINQVPLHAAFFLTITAAVRYFRTRRLLWLILLLAGVLLGMAFYVKAVLFLPMVAGLAFLFFGPERTSPGSGARGRATDLLRSTVGTLRAYAPLWVVSAVLGATYSVFYTRTVNNPLEGYTVEWAALADNFFRVSLGTGLVGGPWRWWNPIPPGSLVDPPSWAVTITWIAAALGAYWLWQRGTARWRALLLLGGYLVAIFLLMAFGRAVILGPVVALELRYLADATPVVVLCLGLLLLDVRTPRDSAPHLRVEQLRTRPVLATLLIVTVVLVGAGVSTVRYVSAWHDDYAGRVYVHNVAAGAELHDLRVVDAWVPAEVVSPLRFPDNYVSRVFRQFPNVRALTSGNDLAVLDEQGFAQRAGIQRALSSPRGPVAGCGYPVKSKPTTIRLRPPADAIPLEPSWWASVAYFAGEDATLDLRLGESRGTYQVMQGVHQLFLRGEGVVDSATLSLESSGGVVCVEQIRVGKVDVWEPRTGM